MKVSFRVVLALVLSAMFVGFGTIVLAAENESLEVGKEDLLNAAKEAAAGDPELEKAILEEASKAYAEGEFDFASEAGPDVSTTGEEKVDFSDSTTSTGTKASGLGVAEKTSAGTKSSGLDTAAKATSKETGFEGTKPDLSSPEGIEGALSEFDSHLEDMKAGGLSENEISAMRESLEKGEFPDFEGAGFEGEGFEHPDFDSMTEFEKEMFQEAVERSGGDFENYKEYGDKEYSEHSSDYEKHEKEGSEMREFEKEMKEAFERGDFERMGSEREGASHEVEAREMEAREAVSHETEIQREEIQREPEQYEQMQQQYGH